MKIQLADVRKNIRFQGFLLFAAVLFFYKLFFGFPGNIFGEIINELLVIITVSAFIFFQIDRIRGAKISPLPMVMNIGILNAVLFFLISFSDFFFNGLFDNLYDSLTRPGPAYTFISYFYFVLVLAISSYIFVALREFYYFRQKRDINTYYNTMVLFILLTCLSTLFSRYEGLTFIKNTFLIISILLLVVNSMKISWIAFLVKKEKVSLLILSVIITALFVVNLVNSSAENVHSQVLRGFSTALDQFLNLMMIYGVIYFSTLFFTTLFHIPTAEAFDRKAQEVSSLQFFSRLITEVLDINDLSETVTDITLKVCKADAAWIILRNKDELKVTAQKNIGFVDAGVLSKYIVERQKESRINGAHILKIEKPEGQKLNENYLSLIVAPLKIENETAGYLAAAKKDNFIFDEDDKQAVITFSDYANVAFENSRLVKESIIKERLEKELDVAREVQKKLLPEKSPALKQLDISSVFIPAFEVGGDYYDFFEISPSRLGFIIADVSGKGISSAFIMAEIKGIFESLSHTGGGTKEVLIKANEILKRTLDRKTFISAAYGIFDLEKGSLNISRAGHCPVLLLRGGKIENLRPKGIGLGLVYGSQFNESLDEIVFSLEENDIIVLYTDGITEAKNSEMEDFGSTVFEEILLENKDLSASGISERVIKEVTLFSKNNPQHDDITLVILKWKQKNNLVGVKEWQSSAPQLNN